MKFRKKLIFIFLITFLFSKQQGEVFASGKTIELETKVEKEEKTEKKSNKENKKKTIELEEVKKDDNAQDKTSGTTKQENEERVKELEKENVNKIGTITESVGSDNHIYNGDKRHENRQFLTFTSKSGKEYYLIIDYTKEGEQVQFLTDVSEEELLSVIKETRGDKLKSQKDELKDTSEDKEKLAKEIRAELEKELNNKEKSEKVTKTKKQNLIDLVPYILIGGAVGYFFYNRKKKQREKENIEATQDDEESLLDEEYMDE